MVVPRPGRRTGGGGSAAPVAQTARPFGDGRWHSRCATARPCPVCRPSRSWTVRGSHHPPVGGRAGSPAGRLQEGRGGRAGKDPPGQRHRALASAVLEGAGLVVTARSGTAVPRLPGGRSGARRPRLVRPLHPGAARPVLPLPRKSRATPGGRADSVRVSGPDGPRPNALRTCSTDSPGRGCPLIRRRRPSVRRGCVGCHPPPWS